MNGGEAMEQEQKWIRAIQRRNSQDAAEQLIQSHYDEIYRFVCRQTIAANKIIDTRRKPRPVPFPIEEM